MVIKLIRTYMGSMGTPKGRGKKVRREKKRKGGKFAF
jgi:hypothetical protein